jgi:hypothetical protein
MDLHIGAQVKRILDDNGIEQSNYWVWAVANYEDRFSGDFIRAGILEALDKLWEEATDRLDNQRQGKSAEIKSTKFRQYISKMWLHQCSVFHKTFTKHPLYSNKGPVFNKLDLKTEESVAKLAEAVSDIEWITAVISNVKGKVDDNVEMKEYKRISLKHIENVIVDFRRELLSEIGYV